MNTILKADLRRSRDGKTEGEKHFDASVAKAQARGRLHSPVATGLVETVLPGLVGLFERDAEKARHTRGNSPFKALAQLDDPVRICTIAAQAAFLGMVKPEKLADVAERIGDHLENELIRRALEKKNYGAAKRAMKRINTLPTPFERGRALRSYACYQKVLPTEDRGSDFQRKNLGKAFIVYLEELGLFGRTSIRPRSPYLPNGKRKRPSPGLKLSAAAALKVQELVQLLRSRAFAARPCLLPPIPWTAPTGGGFRDRGSLGLPPMSLVIRACKEQQALLFKQTTKLGQVYAGVNALQSTAWRINRAVYTVARTLLGGGQSPAELSALDAAMDDADLGRPVYFVHQLDRRGRVYARSDFLSPQGSDLEKALLEFARGDRMTGDSARWLRIHLANCHGEGKRSFDDRIAWADEHEDMILRCADDPYQNCEWREADDGDGQWRFLAACFAWADYKKLRGRSVCRVPITLDGTCSGLQHYSALMRDGTTGAAVNLKKLDAPGDLYDDVAQRVRELLAEKGNGLATTWLKWGITRRTVKQAVMVMPYGGAYASCDDYVREAVRRRGEPKWPDNSTRREAYKMLVGIVWKGMNETAAAPKRAMNWVQSVVEQWERDAPQTVLNWTAPTDFPVVCDRFKRKPSHDVKVHFDGEDRYLPSWGKLTSETDWAKVRTAAPPNFIHSLDASHLIFSVNRAVAEGITQLTTVHDAFGTTPARTARLAVILREEFARLYSADQFAPLIAAARAAQVQIAPSPPREDSLKLADIEAAEYLFS